MSEMSSAAYALLRDCQIEIGLDFLRCGRNVDTKTVGAVICEICQYTGSSSDDVYLSHHPERGDYVRVNKGCGAYRLVCQMKS